MHKLLTVIIASFLLLASCDSKNDGSLEARKAEMTRLKDQQDKLSKQITDLQAQIDKMDPASATAAKTKLISLVSLKDTSFTHFIDLQGNVVAENYSNVSPQGNGGVVRAINIKVGDHVSKGQSPATKPNSTIIKTCISAAKISGTRRSGLRLTWSTQKTRSTRPQPS